MAADASWELSLRPANAELASGRNSRSNFSLSETLVCTHVSQTRARNTFEITKWSVHTHLIFDSRQPRPNVHLTLFDTLGKGLWPRIRLLEFLADLAHLLGVDPSTLDFSFETKNPKIANANAKALGRIKAGTLTSVLRHRDHVDPRLCSGSHSRLGPRDLHLGCHRRPFSVCEEVLCEDLVSRSVPEGAPPFRRYGRHMRHEKTLPASALFAGMMLT